MARLLLLLLVLLRLLVLLLLLMLLLVLQALLLQPLLLHRPRQLLQLLPHDHHQALQHPPNSSPPESCGQILVQLGRASPCATFGAGAR